MKSLAGLMKQASQMQAKMQEMQAKMEAMEIEGVSGAGMVTVTLSGKGGHVAARAAARGADRFVASLAVPRKLRGGFWPVVATYRGTSGNGALRTQVKVVTP